MTNKEIKIAFAEYGSLNQLAPQDKIVAEAAVEAMKSAYAPYSNFHVGAAVMFEDGEIIKGSNQENAAYPSGICAERTAMFYANASRPDGIMTAIAIAGGLNGELASDPATPCGACRQVMAQYQLKGGKPMSVILVGASKIWKFEKVDDILPLIFDSI
jgi:cytidine deaminase